MCDFSGKLIAWLDDELPATETVDIERHVGGCAQCRSRVNLFEQVGNHFNAYCEAVLSSKERRRLPRWTPVLTGVAATATIAALLLVFLPAPVEQPPLAGSAATLPPPIVLKTGVTPVPSRRRHATGTVQIPRQIQYASWPEPAAIQIAIPADEMFPPGAVPAGVNFVAELSIAADGSAEQLRLRP